MSILLEKKVTAANEFLASKLKRELETISVQTKADRMGFACGVSGGSESMNNGDQILDELIAEIDKMGTAADLTFSSFD